jgi:23S rRNA pseudouridine955/2504/2580 synthase
VQNIFSIYPEPMRLDRFLRAVFGPLLIQGVIEKGCRKKQILVNQKPAEPKTRVVLKDEITLLVPAHFPVMAPKQKYETVLDFKDLIIQDFSDFCVINKPYGVPSQGGLGITESIDSLAGDGYWIVHRLDQNTEGLMILAKNRQTATALSEMFKNHQIQKYYYAIVRGRPPEDSGVIDVPLLNVCVDGEDKMVPDPAGQKAITHYRAVKQLNAHHSLVLLKPLTGRKHQLRAHMLTLGTPILGDMKYGKRAKRMHLYAYKIEFVWQGEKVSVLLDQDQVFHAEQLQALL